MPAFQIAKETKIRACNFNKSIKKIRQNAPTTTLLNRKANQKVISKFRPKISTIADHIPHLPATTMQANATAHVPNTYHSAVIRK